MKKTLISALAIGTLLTAGVAFAQTDAPANTASTTPAVRPLAVTFPIASLGGCDSKEACRIYCDDSAHKDACYAYAKPHGLMTDAQITLAKKLIAQVGPGGCRGEACKAYCENVEHEDVCVSFAKANGFISKEQADKRAALMKMASTTRPLLPANIRSASSTTPNTLPKPNLSDRPATTTKPLPGTNATGTKAELNIAPASGKPVPQNTAKPPPPSSSADNEQGGSVFLGILRFFGL